MSQTYNFMKTELLIPDWLSFFLGTGVSSINVNNNYVYLLIGVDSIQPGLKSRRQTSNWPKQTNKQKINHQPGQYWNSEVLINLEG